VQNKLNKMSLQFKVDGFQEVEVSLKQ